jgi:hypothetical protein
MIFFILNENQCGFRKGYSTLDNLFVLLTFLKFSKTRRTKCCVPYSAMSTVSSAYKITKSFRYIPSWISISLEIVCNPLNLNFSLNGEKLEIINCFNYVGIELSRTGNFKRAKQSIAGKATVAFCEVLKMGRKHGVDDFK